MADLTFSLFLEDRLADKVRVAVSLEPLVADVEIESVQIQLRSRHGDALGPSLLLPISGALQGPLLSSVEVRSATLIPAGSLVVATVWRAGSSEEALCPADPGPLLERHVLGTPCVAPPDRGHVLKKLNCDERSAIARTLPWIALCGRPDFEVLDTDEMDGAQEDEADDLDIDSVCASMGLSDEDADLLKEILGD